MKKERNEEREGECMEMGQKRMRKKCKIGGNGKVRDEFRGLREQEKERRCK